MNFFRYIIIFLFTVSSVYTIFAQKDPFLQCDIGSAYILPGYSGLPDYGPNYQLRVRYGNRLTDNKSWNKNYNYPYVSVNAFFSHNTNLALGSIFAVYPDFGFILKEKKKYEMRISAGLGIAFFNKIYHPEYNPQNMLIGSYCTATGAADLLFRYKVSSQWSACLQAGVIHFSNGHTRLPNLGINMPYVMLGTNYWFREEPKYQVRSKLAFDDARSKGVVRYGLGFHQFGESAKPWGGPVYVNQVLSIALAHNYSPIAFLSFGVNFTYYDSFYHFMLDQEVHEVNTLFNESCMITVFAAHEFLFGKIGVYTELGFDIYKPFYRKYALYYDNTLSLDETIKSFNSNKLGLQYHFFKPIEQHFDVMAGVYIKSNFGQADFLECAISIAF
ncbi:MAG TPA: acyloxyacyl hydrolase [Bacteroidales bacterium]|nr:acyloxyacyl hydrolase [Bacteroidales bacterium]HQL69693.1 acyloxyacyl hydrolase [Bacteroidales bacterium]